MTPLGALRRSRDGADSQGAYQAELPQATEPVRRIMAGTVQTSLLEGTLSLTSPQPSSQPILGQPEGVG